MKKFTQADFDSFERDEYGYKICPTGDYTAIKEFGNGCSFGNDCSFGDWCRFGEDCIFGNGCSFESGKVQNGKYIAIDRIGCENRKAYFFVDENGKMYVRTGCWFSDIDEFKERVKEVHAGTIHEKEYLAACDFAELMLKEVEK